MQPLASLLRPTNLDQVVGQTHLVGPDKPLRKLIESGSVFSMIFWGPPGVGKTTLARMIAQQTHRGFYELSAVSAGKAEVKQIIERITSQKDALPFDQPAPVVFLDEIHRFNKAQQDFLLPYVENGTIILIGATTENPSFEVIPALLSRTRVFTLKSLSPIELAYLASRAWQHLAPESAEPLSEETIIWLSAYANGDARKLLTIIDSTWQLYQTITTEALQSALQSNQIRYDKNGEEHYDTISAFIKSMRASKPDAALYYLARMIEGGEDPKFIARRMVIFASEDIGLAQPTALVVANAVFEAVQSIGYPEAQINLAHGVAYLSQCQKNRSAYDAYFAALDDVKRHGNLEIPFSLRNAPTTFMKKEGYGKGYEMYPDDHTSLLPDKLSGKTYLKKK